MSALLGGLFAVLVCPVLFVCLVAWSRRHPPFDP